jgi:hypothetical protein
LASGSLSLLILSGIVLRQLDLFEASAIELLADGDLLAPLAILPSSLFPGLLDGGSIQHSDRRIFWRGLARRGQY